MAGPTAAQDDRVKITETTERGFASGRVRLTERESHVRLLNSGPHGGTMDFKGSEVTDLEAVVLAWLGSQGLP